MAEYRGPYATCAVLKAMLSEGWEIEPPVYVRPHWRSTVSARPRKTYHFILWRDRQVNLVSVPESSEIRRFLTQCELAVDAL
jgi:hypothetical protein